MFLNNINILDLLNMKFPSLPCTSVSKQVFEQNLSYEKEFDSCENEPGRGNSFSYEWFRTKTRFETEAKTNSEIAYFDLRRFSDKVNSE